MHHFEITMGDTCADTVVKMDGKVVTGLKSFTVECGVDDIPRITLELDVAETSLLSGRTQVWIRDSADQMAQSVDTANRRAKVADRRADVAEARADAAESVHPPQGGTLAYIVPVDGSTLNVEASLDKVSKP
jgi:hypothetical protein